MCLSHRARPPPLWYSGIEEIKQIIPRPLVYILHCFWDREVACSASNYNRMCLHLREDVMTQSNVALSTIHSLFIHSFIYSFIHLFIHSFIHSFIHLFIHSFIHSFIYSFLLIHSFIHSFIHSCLVKVWAVKGFTDIWHYTHDETYDPPLDDECCPGLHRNRA